MSKLLRINETDASCSARRFVRHPQQEQRLPCLSVSRHGDKTSPDDAASRARNLSSSEESRDETTHQPSSGADICADATEKAPEEAAGFDREGRRKKP